MVALRNQKQRRMMLAEETAKQLHFDMIENSKKRLRVASFTLNQNHSTSYSRFIPTIPLNNSNN